MDEQQRIDEEADDYIKKDALWTNILLSLLFANFAYQYSLNYSAEPRLSTFLGTLQVSTLAIFFLIRVYPKKTSYKTKDWVFALIGTWSPFLILPIEGNPEIPIFLVLQLIGLFISIIAVLGLNRSFAIVPALRHIKTRGLYRVIRHPIYFGYFLAFSCFIAQNISIFNVIVLLIIGCADIMRIKAEEEFLSEDPQYRAYKERVRWRLIPFIW